MNSNTSQVMKKLFKPTEMWKDNVNHQISKSKVFRDDGSVYNAAEFRVGQIKRDQKVTFCSIYDHHQKSISNQYICTMIEKVINILLHEHSR